MAPSQSGNFWVLCLLPDNDTQESKINRGELAIYTKRIHHLAGSDWDSRRGHTFLPQVALSHKAVKVSASPRL